MSRSMTSVVFLVIAWGAATQAAPPSASEPGVSLFESQVRSLLTDKCLSCHSGDQPKGKLDLTRRTSALAGGDGGEAIVPGKPTESVLFEKIASGEMPPKNPLSAEQIGAVKTWIEAGAPYSGEPLSPRRAGNDWWSLRKIAKPAPPTVLDPTHWSRTPIDAFILAKLQANGLEPSQEADRTALIRRATFDLTGLPPTPEEVRAFVNDPAADAYERLVDRLLESPKYGERWGRHWLDVMRFGESQGYETNMLRPNAWPYRDYVIRAFNRDTPFPRFALEQLAGDSLLDGDWLTEAATGFLVGGTHDEVGIATIEGQLQQRADDLDDIITATGTAFLGLTVNCARCHDHKFDPIKQKDYYGLSAVFAGVQHGERPVARPDSEARRQEAVLARAELGRVESALDDLEPLARPDLGAPGRGVVKPQRNVERFPAVEARSIRFTVLATNDGSEPCIDEIEVMAVGTSPRNIALALAGAKASASSEYADVPIHKIAHLNDGKVGNSHSWISRVPSKGWVQIDLPKTTAIDRIVWGRDREGSYKDRLATEYYIEAQDGTGQWRVIASSGDRPSFQVGGRPQDAANSSKDAEARASLLARQQALRERLTLLGSTRPIYAGNFTQPGPSHLLRRGDPMQKQEQVSPSAISSIHPPLVLSPESPEVQRRRALAEWLGHADNPLPARVMVNRVWHYHFGRGIVATPSDFGFNGAPPSHPELLDWLASEYIHGGFVMKPLHRLIMLSAAYRQSSQPVPKAQAKDRDNTLLWRVNPRRLEAEAIRDAVLTTSGQLNPAMGGPSYSLWEKNTNYVAVYKAKAKLGPDEFRRMVYQLKPRTQQDPTFGAFDCPDPALVAPRRNISTTALQALNLLNSQFLVDQSQAFAARLKAETGDDPTRQAQRGFQLAFSRNATDRELQAAAPLIRDHGVETFCRALYNANEFLYVP